MSTTSTTTSSTRALSFPRGPGITTEVDADEAPASNTIHLPQPIRLRAVRHIINERAERIGAPRAAVRYAMATALREMQSGRSAASAVAIGVRALRMQARA